MHRRLTVLFVVLAMSGTMLLSAGTASAAPPAVNINDIPISGTLSNGGEFVGTFDLNRFAVQDGTLVAVGELSGTLTDAAGVVIGTVTDLLVRIPVTQASGTCQILHLELGPLDLDLLGLVVHLDRVVLDITAESGPGNLLGNLLCGIAGLLDGDAALSAIARLLNQLLGILG
jgi:hypothetical protein